MCVFCDKIMNNDFMFQGDLVTILKDGNPVTNGHVLIMPNRCVTHMFDMTPEEHASVVDAICQLKNYLAKEDPTITGFNIGWNCGTSAGQTVAHAHCHMIPRRNGDCGNPVGGVRGVIPCMQDYTK